MSIHSFVLASRIVAAVLIVMALLYGIRQKKLRSRLIATAIFCVSAVYLLISFLFVAGILKSIETKPFQTHLNEYASWVSLAIGQPCPRGKILPVNISSYRIDSGGDLAYKDPAKPEIDNIFLFMPAAMRAKAPDDVKIILWVGWGANIIKQYTDYSFYAQIICTVYVVDKEKGAIVGCRTFKGSKPEAPEKRTKARGTGQLENIYGSNPVDEIISYLQTLPGKVDEDLKPTDDGITKRKDGESYEPFGEKVILKSGGIEKREMKIVNTIGHDEKKVDSQLSHMIWGEAHVEGWPAGVNRSVPAETDLLLVAQPGTDLFPEEVDAISDYLKKGGRVLLLAAPSVSKTGVLKQEKLQTWLKEFGIILGDDLVVDVKSPAFLISFALPCGEHPIVRRLRLPNGNVRYVCLELSRSVRCEGLNKNAVSTEILRTSPGGWAEKDLEAILKKAKLSCDKDDLQSPVPVAVTMEYGENSSVGRKNTDKLEDKRRPDEGVGGGCLPGRMVVVGSDFFLGDSLHKFQENRYFVSAVMDWLLEGKKLYQPRRFELQSRMMHIGPDLE